MSLDEYIAKKCPDIIEEFKRLATPNYYECGVEYYPLVSGFGGSGKEYKKLMLKECTVAESTVIYHLYDVADPRNTYSVTSQEIYKKLKRVDENVRYKRNIQIDKAIKFVRQLDGNIFIVTSHTWKNHFNKRTDFKVVIRCSDTSFFEYYSMVGKGVANLKHHYKGDLNTSTFEANVSVRKMKEIVFGDPNIKITELFEYQEPYYYYKMMENG